MPTLSNPLGVYEVEVQLSLRLIEDPSLVDQDQEHLLDLILEFLRDGEEDYMEVRRLKIETHPLKEEEASPPMRQKLLVLRNKAA